jgi:hypothetical protein
VVVKTVGCGGSERVDPMLVVVKCGLKRSAEWQLGVEVWGCVGGGSS